MPKYVDAKDSSARTLDLYKSKMGIKTYSVKSKLEEQQEQQNNSNIIG